MDSRLLKGAKGDCYMKRLWTILAVAFTVAAVGVGASAAEADKPANAAPPVIKGVVLDKDNKPIRNAQVTGVAYQRKATGWDGLNPEKVPADKTGHFVYKPKSKSDVGYYIVVATANGYACGAGYYNADDKRQADELKIVLKPGFTLKGKVVDETGKPISGAKVEVENCYGYSSGTPGDNIPGNPGGALTTTTDKTGKFAIARLLKPTEYDQYYVSVGVSKAGRAKVQRSFSRRDSNDEVSGGVTIKQPVECKAEGVLYLPGKAGTAPAGVEIAVLGPSEYGWDPRMCTTDKDGKFHLGALPPGKSTFVLGPRGFSFDENGKPSANGKERGWVLPAVVRTIKPKEVAKVDLISEPGALIKGKVRTKKGDAAKSAMLVIKDRCVPGGPYASWHTVVCVVYVDFTVRVSAGSSRIGVQRWYLDWYNDEELPSGDLKVADGDEKTDVAITIDENPSSSRSGFDYQKATKVIPADFALTPGAYDLKWDPEVDCSSAIQSYSQMEESKVKGAIKGLPKLSSTKPKYFACRFDGSKNDGCLVIVADESQGTGKGYDTAYVDLNRNWDLSDDKPITFPVPKDFRQFYTDFFSVPLRQHDDDGRISDRTVQARLEVYGDGHDYLQVQVSRKGAWKGTVDSSSGKIECLVLDSSCNGVCGEPTKFAENGNETQEGDLAFFDTNGAGGVIAYAYGSHGIRLYQTTKVGSKFYDIKTSSLGDKITVAPYTGPMGSLIVRGTDIQGLKAETTSLVVTGTPGNYTIDNGTEKAVSLPVGSYSVNSCSLRVKSKDSRSCSMSCELNSPVEVKPNAQSIVNIGGKLSMAISPSEKNLTWKPGESATLEWVIKLGTTATLSSIGDRSSASDVPKLKFFNSKGKLIHTAKAGYT